MVSLHVEGQPVFNDTKTLVAFPNCADDGCQREVGVVDVRGQRLRPSVAVPEEGQVYLSCSWATDVLRVTVNTLASDGREQQSTHTFDLSEQE
jgi:hypothetical protein